MFYMSVLLVLVGEHVLSGASCACLLNCVSHVLRGGNDLVAYQASILIYHNPDYNSNPGPETCSAGVPYDRRSSTLELLRGHMQGTSPARAEVRKIHLASPAGHFLFPYVASP